MQRKKAIARLELLKKWDIYRGIKKAEGKNMTNTDDQFITLYNTGEYLPAIFSLIGTVSIKTLYRWQQNIAGTQDYSLLIPQGSITNNHILEGKEEQMFLGLLLHPNKIKIGDAIRLMEYKLKREGIAPKSRSAYRKYADVFKAKHFDRWVLMREGQKALRDKVAPYIQRDPSLLDVGDILIADGHRLNFQVINPFTGKPCRAVLVGYLDWKSYDLCGYEIMVEENTQCIASALRNSILRLGFIPKLTYQDNGKAFRAKFFTSIDSLEDAGIDGLFSRLGIIPIFAQPYNARAKIIERWFKEFSSTFERLVPSYTGASIEDKPAYMMRNEKFHRAIHNEYIPKIGEAVQMIEAWLEFHRSQPCPHVKGKTIKEVWEEGVMPACRTDRGQGSGINIAELDDLMMARKIATIGRNGVRFLNADYYDDNLYGLRDQVIVKYSLFDLSSIRVYTTKGDFLCTAQRVMRVHPAAHYLGDIKDVEELKQKISHHRRLERQTINLAKEFQKQIGENGRSPLQSIVDWEGISHKAIEKMDDHTGQPQGIAPTNFVGGAFIEGQESAGDPVPSPYDNAPQPPLIRGGEGGVIERPVFQGGIERFEWHRENGAETEEDHLWIAAYVKTQEYRMAFEFFEKQNNPSSILPLDKGRLGGVI